VKEEREENKGGGNVGEASMKESNGNSNTKTTRVRE
jgi:hypothetical protein